MISEGPSRLKMVEGCGARPGRCMEGVEDLTSQHSNQVHSEAGHKGRLIYQADGGDD